MVPPVLPESDAELARSLGEERAAWTTDWTPFRAFVAERPTALAAYIGDLQLSFCAGHQLDAAVGELAERLHRLALSSRRTGISDDTIDEARQILLERLVIGRAGAAPKIWSYEGQGALDGWLRVALAREALYLHKRSRAHESERDSEDLLALEDSSDDPEFDYLKAHYRDKFRTAFESACEALEQRERSLLRQHLVLGIGIERLAAIYGVHRTTIARWIDTAKEDLMRRTKRALEAELKLASGELERVAALIQSRLDFSLQRVLRSRRQ